MNVIRFPVCRHGRDGLHWYGGRGYKTKQEVRDAMSDKDWRRNAQWESRYLSRILAQEEKRKA
jgi:hypothetical protein